MSAHESPLEMFHRLVRETELESARRNAQRVMQGFAGHIPADRCDLVIELQNAPAGFQAEHVVVATASLATGKLLSMYAVDASGRPHGTSAARDGRRLLPPNTVKVVFVGAPGALVQGGVFGWIPN